jgi:hypothetical protein
MPEVFSSIASALALAKKLKEATDKTRDADTKLLVAELHVQLAEAKMELSNVLDENTRLKAKVRELENPQGAPCPHCHKRGWHVERSERDELTGELGGMRRTYRCSFCNFSEDKLVLPHKGA